MRLPTGHAATVGGTPLQRIQLGRLPAGMLSTGHSWLMPMRLKSTPVRKVQVRLQFPKEPRRRTMETLAKQSETNVFMFCQNWSLRSEKQTHSSRSWNACQNRNNSLSATYGARSEPSFSFRVAQKTNKPSSPTNACFPSFHKLPEVKQPLTESCVFETETNISHANVGSPGVQMAFRPGSLWRVWCHRTPGSEGRSCVSTQGTAPHSHTSCFPWSTSSFCANISKREEKRCDFTKYCTRAANHKQ